MIKFNWYSFTELTNSQLYNLLALRAEVFVVEQNCIYQDIDGNDTHAIHLIGVENEKVVAYLRLFPPTIENNYVKFGRVVTSPFVRHLGYGKQLIRELLHYCEIHYPTANINCSAQYYLKHFYESFGFTSQGGIYNEDGIPHIAMNIDRSLI